MPKSAARRAAERRRAARRVIVTIASILGGLAIWELIGLFVVKNTLFLATLDRYGDRAVAMVAAALSKPVHIRESLGAFLQQMVEGIVAGPARTGCFIGNCTAEVSRHDREAAVRIQRNIARIEATFRSAFEQAQKRGDLPPDTDVEALARYFVVTIQGLRLMGKKLLVSLAMEGKFSNEGLQGIEDDSDRSQIQGTQSAGLGRADVL